MFVTGAVYGRLGVNVALNRPTFMKSVWDGNTWGANDGDRTPTNAGGSCVSTWMQTDPWWAVDLGAALAVLGVFFTNKAEGKGNVSGLRYYFPVSRSQTAFLACCILLVEVPQVGLGCSMKVPGPPLR